MITRNYFKIVRVFPDPSDYFYIKNEGYESGTIGFSPNGDELRESLEYKIDNGSWVKIVDNMEEESIYFDLQPNSKLYLRGTTGYWKNVEGEGAILDEIGFGISIGGDLRTLLDYTDVDSVTTIPENCFNYAFASGNLVSIDNLTLGSSVTTIEQNALREMFAYAQIQKGLDLSGVTTLGESALVYMYNECSSLNEVYAPNVSTWNTSKTTGWLNGVASTGVIYKPANLTIPTNNISGVPSGWTTQTYPQN